MAFARIPVIPVVNEPITTFIHKPSSICDSGSEKSVVFEKEPSESGDCLVRNREFMNEQMKDWDCDSGTTHGIVMVKPTASNIPHRCLNPHVYRHLGNVESLDKLADILDAPKDWFKTYEMVCQARGGAIFNMFELFKSLDNVKSDVGNIFLSMVMTIAAYLPETVVSGAQTKVIVGGILALAEYDFLSETDPSFRDLFGRWLLASEIKVPGTWNGEEPWHHACRGTRVFSALYGYNCPVLLFTLCHFKLFIENSDRNKVLTFPSSDQDTDDYIDIQVASPYGDEGTVAFINSAKVAPMGLEFLQIIVICLLSKRNLAEAKDKMSLQVTPSGQLTSSQPGFGKDTVSTPSTEPQGGSSRVTRSQPKPAESTKKMPSFFSGFDSNGDPVYTFVRVVPLDQVEQIEDQLGKDDEIKEERNNKQP